MADLNKWIGMGRLTANPELKQTPNGTSVATFTIACNRIPNQSGEQTADFINIVAWAQTAEFVCRFFKKGNMVCVEGSVQTRSWTAQDGSKRYVTEIKADSVYFTGEKAESTQEQTPTFTNAKPNYEEVADDDLPF